MCSQDKKDKDQNSYKSTLNLPDTSFPMKANLKEKEPEMLKYWEQIKVYDLMVKSGGRKGDYVLHDGPPYANGHIHLGTALNKILKDIIVKSKALDGFKAQYVPGWDCHGLPIELKVEHELGEKKKTLPAHVVRKCCRSYAEKYVDIQRKEFKRLGVLGVWDKPYMTMQPEYEASTSRVLSDFMEKGSVVRSKKPIHWCCSCHTALAEAEVEYYDHKSSSIFVRFPITDPKLNEIFPQAKLDKTYVVIWTTTPWTLPDNMAISLHPNFEYALVEHENAFYILANELVESCAKSFGWNDYKVIAITTGDKLEGLKATHPFYNRTSPLILGEHVTLEAGSGCVHTAPGHGREDYDVGLKYGLEIYSPMNHEGRFAPEVECFAGLTVFEANPKVIEKLKEVGNLLAEAKISHSYPHCWRCKEPVIFRATTQWFISMEKNDLRKNALKAIRDNVNWIPAWGEERIYSMIENRPDWCISRQRTWGVPITALLCESCGEAWHDAKWAKDIADRYAKHATGCDYWFEADIKDIVPEGLVCEHCKGTTWRRETDILDVWFDSGTSFAAVLEGREECRFPADLYLEGSDQHRGWFHSSLLASVGTRGVPPYKAVLTHGYVVDGEGRKMSKSIGNVVAPQEIIDKYGAEILRIWVSSVDYREDVRISDEILGRLVDAYRRLRNTCRYFLGNLGDFKASDAIPLNELDPLDFYALSLVSDAHKKMQDAYVEFEFHKVFHTLHNLCTTELSAFYLDILKDRLYSSAKDSKERRSAQTALWHILMLLLRNMAPILSFTAEEVFRNLPSDLKPQSESVLGIGQNEPITCSLNAEQEKAFGLLVAVRNEVTKAIEHIRREGVVGHALDTRVTLYLGDKQRKMFESLGTELRPIFIVSQLILEDIKKAPSDALTCEIEEVAIKVEKAKGEKCARCWIYSEELGTNPEHPTICPRCTAVLIS
ncbi:isoleucine--tRNA ligase [Desulfovibrio litoralis]|uniref:Isoleucine--tRNA ligase n=1 Tax=Desulfovibrio litoralis DSM 11393 TaxID=1121455 RepID=A0A1M7T7J6_9BACT|nr:isoleucine--tRNA ligase [Desulfovibrio litoralis]SHN66647.1 Isoleucyl-tRNA synthetase [Desulfovibrio litoralis DSM 11393]